MDADSEGVEGKFYVWSKTEIEQVLGDDAALFCACYDVSADGNWEHTNILWRPLALDEYAGRNGLDAEALAQQMSECRKKLFQERAVRVRPGLDDKVLAGWNGLMASAYARAYTALGHEHYRETAVRTIEFILENMTAGVDGRLYHTWKNERLQIMAVLEDYAFLIAALVDIWQISFNFKYLTSAKAFMEQVFTYFHDAETGLFFYTAADQTDIILRRKDLYDNATPSGNSTMAHNLQRLGILLDRSDWREQATRMLDKMYATVERYPLSFERWALAVAYETHPYQEIAVVGANAFEKAKAVRQRFLPNSVLAAGLEESATIPLLSGKSGDPDALIYVCHDYVCQKPVQSLEEFDQLIRNM